MGEVEESYFIKFTNISLFSAYDIFIELIEVDHYPAAKGQMNSRHQPLTVVLNRTSNIPGYRPSWMRPNAPYANIARSRDDLDKILNNEHKSVLIKVSMRHGLTGLVKVHTKEYTDPSDIKKGKFKYGLSFGYLS